MTSSDNSSSATAGFFDRKTTREFGKAISYLTVILNVILYIASTVNEDGLSNLWLVLLILGLSAIYVFAFIRRMQGESTPQYIFASTINIALLFTSLSGTNKLLDKARPEPAGNNEPTNTQASIGGALVHIIFPTQSLFSEKREALAIVNAAEVNIDSATNLIQDIIKTNEQKIQVYSHVIDSMQQNIDTIKKEHLATVDVLKRSERILSALPSNGVGTGTVPPQEIAETKNLVQQQVQQQQIQVQQLEQRREQTEIPQQQIQQVEQQQLLQQRQEQLKDQKMQLKNVQEEWSGK